VTHDNSILLQTVEFATNNQLHSNDAGESDELDDSDSESKASKQIADSGSKSSVLSQSSFMMGTECDYLDIGLDSPKCAPYRNSPLKEKLGFEWLQVLYPNVGMKGDPTMTVIANTVAKLSKTDPGLANSAGFGRVLSYTSHLAIAADSVNCRVETNDGYWVRFATCANIMEYFFPIDKAYEAIEEYRAVVRNMSFRLTRPMKRLRSIGRW
jgi:hypothetical protein